jgi:hypothetical protein
VLPFLKTVCVPVVLPRLLWVVPTAMRKVVKTLSRLPHDRSFFARQAKAHDQATLRPVIGAHLSVM